ncbi:hypothetical protein GT346_42900 [Streptomyces sp. SID161]|nr:hypothetical protein [Streptomyces sp. SID161]MYW48840.1 hypothetical protein [Streptomyces sp. SID161]MYW49875.1 hypothetical protein [Streptomyces sp. SID161]
MLAKKTIEAAWLNGAAYDLATIAAEALESAQLLQSPEIAAELEQLRTVYRASHDSIVMGLYTTAAAARKHCEAEEQRAWSTSSSPTFDWIEDEEDSVAEMTVWVGGEETATGYVVTAQQVASDYDEGADE